MRGAPRAERAVVPLQQQLACGLLVELIRKGTTNNFKNGYKHLTKLQLIKELVYMDFKFGQGGFTLL